MCLIDAMYNITVYDLPLFTLYVLSNDGYIILLTDESIAAGLQQVVDWNSVWQPHS